MFHYSLKRQDPVQINRVFYVLQLMGSEVFNGAVYLVSDLIVDLLRYADPVRFSQRLNSRGELTASPRTSLSRWITSPR